MRRRREKEEKEEKEQKNETGSLPCWPCWEIGALLIEYSADAKLIAWVSNLWNRLCVLSAALQKRITKAACVEFGL